MMPLSPSPASGPKFAGLAIVEGPVGSYHLQASPTKMTYHELEADDIYISMEDGKYKIQTSGKQLGNKAEKLLTTFTRNPSHDNLSELFAYIKNHLDVRRAPIGPKLDTLKRLLMFRSFSEGQLLGEPMIKTWEKDGRISIHVTEQAHLA